MQRWFHALLAIPILIANSSGAPQNGGAKRFDYYVFSLSWSPEHCAETHDTSAQCTGPKSFGFVVHGLWPNATSGPNPMNCDGPALNPRLVTKDLLDIMPSESLIRHEWETHGRCSGMDQPAYFQRVQDAWSLVTIPADLKSPDHSVALSPGDIRKRFAASNPTLPATAFAVTDNGHFLQEVRVCLTKDLKGMACSSRGDMRTSVTIELRPGR